MARSRGRSNFSSGTAEFFALVLLPGLLRTVEPDAVDDVLIDSTESALMRLSEAVAAAYLTHNERAEPRWDALE